MGQLIRHAYPSLTSGNVKRLYPFLLFFQYIIQRAKKERSPRASLLMSLDQDSCKGEKNGACTHGERPLGDAGVNLSLECLVLMIFLD